MKKASNKKRTASNPNAAILIQQMPRSWWNILHDITGIPVRTIQDIVYRYDSRHKIWPIITALATPDGVINAREKASLMGYTLKAAA